MTFSMPSQAPQKPLPFTCWLYEALEHTASITIESEEESPLFLSQTSASG